MDARNTLPLHQPLSPLPHHKLLNNLPLAVWHGGHSLPWRGYSENGAYVGPRGGPRTFKKRSSHMVEMRHIFWALRFAHTMGRVVAKKGPGKKPLKQSPQGRSSCFPSLRMVLFLSIPGGWGRELDKIYSQLSHTFIFF